ncbi:MAG: fumarylacetoacetate hydrolase family protein, partial [Saprospiraceae bacterium]|nr:fumarylacetoacetate hydrolase family protein [Saprospiraceae bacterium]
KVPKQPMIFIKPESAVNPTDVLDYPSFTKDLHYELELVLKINKKVSNISLDNASACYDEIGLGIDFTARDIQYKCKEKGHPWEKAKAFDNSATVGSFLKKSELDISNVPFKLTVNGEKRQIGFSKDMIFNFDYLVHYISKYFTLEEGDLIFTGTPEGVGPVKPGDVLNGYLDDKLLLNVSIN